MNKLPIEIENSIWNMYYMDHYCKIVNELNTIINVNLSLSEKIEEAKKHIRKYRFYDICNDNAKSLFMVLNKDISTNLLLFSLVVSIISIRYLFNLLTSKVS